jgi:hypothetical protein
VASDLVFLFSADADIQKAYGFYEVYQTGKGEVFMRHLDLAFSQLRNFPEIAPVFFERYRRLLVSGFPFGIFYSVEGRRVIIFGGDESSAGRRNNSPATS